MDPGPPWWTDEKRVIRVVSVGGGVITVIGVILLIALAIQAGLLGPTGRVILAYVLAAALAGASWLTARRGLQAVVPATLAAISAWTAMLTSAFLPDVFAAVPGPVAQILIGVFGLLGAAGTRRLGSDGAATAVVAGVALVMGLHPLRAEGPWAFDVVASALVFPVLAACALLWWGSAAVRTVPVAAVIGAALAVFPVSDSVTRGAVAAAWGLIPTIVLFVGSMLAIVAMASRRATWPSAAVAHILAGTAAVAVPALVVWSPALVWGPGLDTPVWTALPTNPTLCFVLAVAAMAVARLLPTVQGPPEEPAPDDAPPPQMPGTRRPPARPRSVSPWLTFNIQLSVLIVPTLGLVTASGSDLVMAVLLAGIPIAVVAWRRGRPSASLETAMWLWLAFMTVVGAEIVLLPIFAALHEIGLRHLAGAVLLLGVIVALAALVIDALRTRRRAHAAGGRTGPTDPGDGAPAGPDGTPAETGGAPQPDPAERLEFSGARTMILGAVALLLSSSPVLIAVQAAGGTFSLGHMVVSVLWMAAAAFIMIGPQRLTGDAPATAGLLLAAAATAKLVLFDMSAMNGWARAFAFLICGVILLVMAIGRSRRHHGVMPPDAGPPGAF
ncbi:hypothetical protein [Corynebacterium sp. 335C]